MREESSSLTNHADKTFNHAFGSLEIGNYPIFKRADGFDILVCFFMHLHGTFSDGDGGIGFSVDGYDGWFIHDDLAVLNYQGIGGAEVDGEFLSEKAE